MRLLWLGPCAAALLFGSACVRKKAPVSATGTASAAPAPLKSLSFSGTGTSSTALPEALVPSACEAPLGSRASQESAALGEVLHYHLNHAGYDSQLPKRVVVEVKSPTLAFELKRDSDSVVVFKGQSGAVAEFPPLGADKQFQVLDFSEVELEGKFYLEAGGKRSPSFELGRAQLARKTLASVLGYFQSSRATHPDVWAADSALPRTGGGPAVNAPGGYYDASGDISKYLSHLSYANYLNPQQIPLVVYSMGSSESAA